MTTPIPQPPTIPFLGNITALESDVPVRSFRLLAQTYGEIFQLTILGRTVVHCCSVALTAELSDESRFFKVVGGPLGQVRNLVGDGLFTAQPDEPNWGLAHRLLMPAFGTANIRNMFPDMQDIASQLLLKWARFGPDHVFDPTDDYTRLTFDTIALCAMGHRLNSFYTDAAPPFTQAMVDFLLECNRRVMRPGIVQTFMRGASAKYDADIKLMTDFAQAIVDHRKATPTDKKDLLSLMLEGKDPKTGEALPEKNIINNLLTFLIAGHETTSGMLSFTTYFLLKSPTAMSRLRAEIDAVCGDAPVTLEHLGRMPYLIAVMRESLRLAPTAPARIVVPKEDTVIGGKYAVKKGAALNMFATISQHDPAVWGEDAEEFRPERMLDGQFEALPAHAWQPFGFGMRGCIGRPFAWQEVQLVIASVLQAFDLALADPRYTLQIKQALTIKPRDLMVRATVRKGREHILSGGAPGGRTTQVAQTHGAENAAGGAPRVGPAAAAGAQVVHVLYGSNSGTCEAFAQRLASDAASHGFSATLATLDSAAERLPTDGPLLIVTASFEGEPADNAAHFVAWLKALPAEPNAPPLKDVRFAVFGCGNTEWARTYQRVPRLIDEQLAAHGAERVLARGEADAASMAFFQDFDQYEVALWKALSERFDVARPAEAVDSAFDVKVVDSGTTRAGVLRQGDAGIGKVLENRLLTKPGVAMKRHIEFELPEGMTYRAGDYLAILPTNPAETVQRAIVRFGLSGEQEVVITSDSPTTFPVDKAISVHQLLSGYVELSQPVTTRDLDALAAASKSEATKTALTKLVDTYQSDVLGKRTTVLDLLEDYPDIALPLSAFLRMLPAMRLRQYSISSSPLADPQRATLTLSVVNAPALSGRPERFLGVASNYLAGLRAGDRAQLLVRPSGAAFHPPADPRTPVVMFCAGSGLAPFRGFVQERAAQKASGRDVGRMLLFFGCRAPDEDYLYGESDLKAWAEMGVVDVRPAFSRRTEESGGCKYVQDRIWQDREDIHEAYREGAKFFTCGSRKAANGVKQVCVDIIKDGRALDDGGAAAAFEKVQKERYATDIFD